MMDGWMDGWMDGIELNLTKSGMLFIYIWNYPQTERERERERDITDYLLKDIKKRHKYKTIKL